jgi:hypothetical protein
VKRYFQLTRAHTVPLEAVPAVVGAMLVTNGEITTGVIAWGIYGVLYHLAGYGQNSLEDYKKGYDKEDESKQHHPLNDGRLDVETAEMVVGGLLIATIVVGIGIPIYQGSMEALLIPIVGLVTGLMYNIYGKTTQLKFVPITIAHTSVFFLSYVSMGGELNKSAFYFSMLVASWVMFQIAFSGEIKDLDIAPTSGEANLWTGEGEIKMMHAMDGFWAGLFLRLLIAAFAIFTVNEEGGGILTVMVIIMTTLASIYYTLHAALTITDRVEGLLEDIATLELLSMFTFLVAASTVIGWYTAMGIMLMAGVWVVSFNRYMWGTYVAPDV